MSEKEQIEAFEADLRKLIERYIAEFNLTTASAIGVLAIKQHELIQSALYREDEDE